MKNEGSVYQRNSDGRWIGAITLGYDENGRQRRKTISAWTRAEAHKKLRSVLRQIEDGLPLPDEQLTVEQLIERWKTVKKHHVASEAFENYSYLARVHVIPTLGRKRAAKLTPSEVDHLLIQKLDAGLSASTVRHIRNVLSMALQQGVIWGVLPRNVAALSMPPKLDYPEGRALSQEQAKLFLAQIQGNRLEAVYITMLVLGLRRGEVLGLKWTDVDLDQGLMTISRTLRRQQGKLVFGDVKTRNSRRQVNLPPELVASLKAHKARQAAERLRAGDVWHDTGLVFTSTIGTPIEPRNLNRDFSTATNAAGLGHWHPHELRHSAASLMLQARVPIEVVSNVLGHSTIDVTADVYGHIQAPQRQEAATKMAGILWGSK